VSWIRRTWEAPPFRDRHDAGRKLAEALSEYADRSGVIVLGLPRGGVPVAHEVAKALGAPMDIFMVRKLGMPGREEFALGAIASGGVQVLNEDAIEELNVSDSTVAKIAAAEQAELERREMTLREGAVAEPVEGRLVILVDDGIATGASMRAAMRALRAQGAAELIVATPVAAPQTCEMLADEADAIVCVRTPEPFLAVGPWYENFDQVTDDEVRALLRDRAGS